jgi:hypothetical protein
MHLLSIFSFAASTAALALSNTAKVPVLLYHSSQVGYPCDYAHSASVALAADLETLHSQGFTVVPLYWITEWTLGIRDGSTLPAKIVGLSFDDGNDMDWIDNAIPSNACAPIKSFKTVLQEFKAAHPTLPWYSPHAAIFVIASPAARLKIDDVSYLYPSGSTGVNDHMNDTWWSAANSSGFMEIYNHSADHDHGSITSATYDASMDIYIPVRGYDGGVWVGQDDFAGIDTLDESIVEVQFAAEYIQSKIGAWPDLFAYPYGLASTYIRGTYFPSYGTYHNTLAAYCTNGGYVTRSSPQYCLPRNTYGIGAEWSTPAGFSSILSNAP